MDAVQSLLFHSKGFPIRIDTAFTSLNHIILGLFRGLKIWPPKISSEWNFSHFLICFAFMVSYFFLLLSILISIPDPFCIFFHLDFYWIPTTPWYFIVSLFRYWLHISIFHLVHSMSSMVSGSLDPLVSGSTRRTRMPARNELGRNKLFWINLMEQNKKNGNSWMLFYSLLS